ncbi:MAG: type VI secretion system tip protein VgrG [Sandaracinaceae bacterium]|nr:type VI secretion system tip protein VgrG [Sandaracinaceae bacterium]
MNAATSAALSDATYDFESEAFPDLHFVVSEVRVTEAIDEPYEIDLVIGLPETSLDQPDMERGSSAATARSASIAAARSVCSAASSGEVGVGDADPQAAWARVVVAPALRVLGLDRTSRIFQDMSVLEILTAVLVPALLPFGRAMFFVPTRFYPRREYCVQYRESTFDFVHRLLEEEGIAYTFDHGAPVELMRLHDSNKQLSPAETGAPDGFVSFEPHDLEVADREPVVQFELRHRKTATEVEVRDHDWTQRQPILIGAAGSPTPPPGAAAVYEHGVGRSLCIHDYAEAQARYRGHDGAIQAALRREALVEEGLVGSGRGRVTAFAPGRRFVLGGHPTIGLDGEYVLTRVEHLARSGDASSRDPYENRFECIPYTREHRPRRRRPKPEIASAQTATVVGPAGEEIHCDVHGRIKVRFHWDREHPADDSASCWVRVQHAWAGPTWGTIFIPRVGMEVLVQFVDGDPDRPLVTGSVYNADNPPPYALPDEKTKSTIKSRSSPGGGGYNELRFEDRAGSEEIWLHGQKDWNAVIENDVNEGVGRDRTRSVRRDESVNIGRDSRQDVARTRTRSVGRDEQVVIGGSRRASVARDELARVGGARDVSVGGSEHRTYGRDLVVRVRGQLVTEVEGQEWHKVRRLVIEAEEEILLKCGDNFVAIGSDRVVIEGYETLVNCGESHGDAGRPQVEAPPEPAQEEPESDD